MAGRFRYTRDWRDGDDPSPERKPTEDKAVPTPPLNEQKGEDGVPGIRGARGAKGDRGEKGERGEKGNRGDKGDKGDRGMQGAAGIRGERGDRGEKGDKGDQGESGEKGEAGAAGSQGAKGDQGLRGEQGEKGEKGERGDVGSQGVQGEKGDRGERGLRGAKGERGEKGEHGEKGDQGERGEKGEQGDKGDRGERGSQGIQGIAGEVGAVGPQGPKGDKGDVGDPAVLSVNQPLVLKDKNLSIDLTKLRKVMGPLGTPMGAPILYDGGGGLGEAFKFVAVAGQSGLTAVQYDKETLTFVAGDGIQLDTDPATNSITITNLGGGVGIRGGTGATGATGAQGATGATGVGLTGVGLSGGYLVAQYLFANGTTSEFIVGYVRGETGASLSIPIATTSLTGVAAFNSTYFTVSPSGLVELSAAYQATGSSVGGGGFTGVSGIRVGAYPQTLTGAVGISSGNNLKITVAGNRITFAGLLLKAVPGAIQFADSLVDDFQADTNFKLNYAGDLSLDVPASINLGRTFSDSGFLVFGDGTTQSTAYTGEVVESINGQDGTVVLSGDGGAITLGSNETTIKARIASSSLTGVASFNSTHFTVSAAGAVTSNGITVKASSGDAGTTLNLGGTLTITGTANQVAVTRSGTDFTLGLPNDITIPGNLTVNGTVVTANVDSFVVEDPLIMLGTGNAADSVDLGFYGQYTSSGKRFAGLYRDASDSGKFKLFTNLTGAAEPTSFVNDGGSGYTVGTLVAKIDGGTF